MTQSVEHKELASGRWQSLTLAEQLGNIGSEVSRALNWQKRGEEENKTRALERALELFDLTLRDFRWQSRLRELARAREVVVDFFWGDNAYQSNPKNLDKYFYQFAFLARKGR